MFETNATPTPHTMQKASQSQSANQINPTNSAPCKKRWDDTREMREFYKLSNGTNTVRSVRFVDITQCWW